MKADKRQVNYSQGHQDAHCGKTFPNDRGFCRHYRPRNDTEGVCIKVEGIIKAIYWCKLFARAPLSPQKKETDGLPAPSFEGR
jgi:hypothetical protein